MAEQPAVHAAIKLELGTEQEHVPRNSAHSTKSRRSTERPSARWRTTPRNVVLGLGAPPASQTLEGMCGVREIDIQALKTVKTLGENALAVVEQCMYTPHSGDPLPVAVKKLKANVIAKQEDMSAFMSEVSVLQKLKHNNIMDYIGIGSVEKGTASLQQSSLFLVMELMEGGTLKRLVMKQMAAPSFAVYSHRDALRWCIQIADALAHMHAASPMIIHRDLKLDNILLKGSEVALQDAKLADLALLEFISKKQHALQALLPHQEQVPGSGVSSTRAAEWLHKLFRSRSLPMPGYTQGSASARHGSPKEASRTAASMRSFKTSFKQSIRSLRHAVTLQTARSEPVLESAPAHDETTSEAANKEASKALFKGSFKESLRRSFKSISDQVFVVDSARRAEEESSKLQLTGRAGTLMYMAPEMFKNEKCNEKVDVFSFGMLMYELLHKCMMVYLVSMKGTEQEAEQYAKRVSQGWRPPIDKRFPAEMRNLINDTWAQHPNDRPSMSEVVERLTRIRDGELLDQLTGGDEPGCGAPGCTIS